jgi:NADPH:quinone reductase-like Zn-dependent oxidoreductase
MAEYDAVVVESYNPQAPADAGKLVKRTAKDPRPHEVQVRMKYAGINPSDVFSCMGVYPGFKKVPGVPGFDGMGIVTKVGSDVTEFKEGQRVTSLGWLTTSDGDGSWQQYITLPADKLVALPDNISDEAGAQFYINPVTVVGLLEVAKVAAGDWVLITAAGSTLGRMLIGAARAAGIKPIAVIRRAEAVQELKETTGVEEVIVTSKDDLVERVRTITGGAMAASVIDCVGGALSQQLGAATRDGGSVWLYGLMEGLTFTGSAVDSLFRDVAYRGFWFFPWLESKSPQEQKAVVQKTLQLMAEGIMDPPIGSVFPLCEFAEAIKESLKVGRIGKVLLKCD